MINFNSLFRSKLFKFLIFLVLLILFAIGFYKENKKEVKNVILMYSEGTNDELKKEDGEHEHTSIIKEKQPIISTFARMQREKKWISKRAEEQKRMMEFIKKQEREEIMKKYKVPEINPEPSKESLEKTAKYLEKNFKTILEHDNLLKNEYESKKRKGEINYRQRVKSKDYVYVLVIPTSKMEDMNKKLKNSKFNFVIHVDAEKAKKFNQKIIGKKINDVVELELEDLLSEERIKILHEGFSNAEEAIKDIVERYPYLKGTAYEKSMDYVRFKMKFTILDVLDRNFIEKNNIKQKVFDYNAFE